MKLTITFLFLPAQIFAVRRVKKSTERRRAGSRARLESHLLRETNTPTLMDHEK